MRRKYFNCNCKLPMNLQFFAESGDGAGTGDTGAGNSNGVGDPNSAGDGTEPLSFDDFLKGEGNQAEFDRRVQKAVNTAVTNAREKWQVMTDDKLSEAEKLAKMTKDEKQQYLQDKKEKELAARESEINRKELMAEAKNTLAGKKLPVELAELLVYTDADSCNESIATMEKAFQAAVESAVQERLKGGAPQKKAPESGENTLAKQVEAIMMGI